MALFKHFPWTDMHALNQNEILEFLKNAQETLEEYNEKLNAFEATLTGLEEDYGIMLNTVSTLRTEMDALSLTVASMQTTLAEHGTILNSFQNTLESIESRLAIIVNDVSSLYSSVNNLGSRVTLLESATINPITMAVSPDSMLVSGSDLRYQPMGDDGFPLSMTYTPPSDSSDHREGLRYNQNKGFVIPDNDTGANEFFTWYGDWNSETQLDKWALTVRIYNTTESTYTDYKFENIIINTHGDGWHDIGTTGVQWDLEAGEFNLRWHFRQDSGANAGYIIRAIKLEKGGTATELIESRKDSDLQMISTMVSGGEATHYTGEAGFNMSVTDNPSITHLDTNFKAVADLWKVGNILSGAIRLYYDTSAELSPNGVTLTELETSSVDINISSWNIPSIKVLSGNLLTIQNNIVTGEQYILSGINLSEKLSTLRLQPHFTSITTASDGYFATIPFTVPVN